MSDRREMSVRPMMGDASNAREHSQARAIERAMDVCIQRGQWEAAARFALAGADLARQAPALAERISRLRLCEGSPEAALNVIEAIRGRRGGLPSSLALLRATALLQSGRLTEAHEQLRQCADDPAPRAGAQELLALTSWDLGGPEEAVQLIDTSAAASCPRLAMIRMLALRASGASVEMLQESARIVLEQLPLRSDDGEAAIFCDLLGLRAHEEAGDALCERLGEELLASEEMLGLLAAAQRLEHDSHVCDAVARAVEIKLEAFGDPGMAAAMAAELLMLNGAWARAAEIVDRGLTLRPMSAALALVSERMTEHGEQAGTEEAA
jgi:hypothetical protein